MNKATAPYNFVSLPDEVYPRYKKKEDLPKHNKIYPEKDNMLSGDITFEIEAVTDISIGGSAPSEFYKDTDGKFGIGGGSLRGLFRTNMQILGLSTVGDDIEDFRYMYRKVGEIKTRLSKEYKKLLGVESLQNISVCKNVRAGYIKNDGGEYYLYDNKETDKLHAKNGEMDYYLIRETEIFWDQFKAEDKDKKFNLFFNNNEFALQHKGNYNDFKAVYKGKCQECKKNNTYNERYKKENELEEFRKHPQMVCKWCSTTVDLKKDHLEGIANEEYFPYFKEISYGVKNRKIQAIGEVSKLGEPDYKNKGYVLSSGHMHNKKVIYVIPEIGTNYIKLSSLDIQTYKRDYENKKNKLGKNNSEKTIGKKEKRRLEKFIEFYDLPKEGEIKPVFYIKEESEYTKEKCQYYFGFTQYLRIFYKHSIIEGIPEIHNQFIYDYARSIFGYSRNNNTQGEPDSYKGRVYFEDAKLIEKVHSSSDSQSDTKEDGLKLLDLALEAPKASSYLDYLDQSEYEEGNHYSVMTYNDAFSIRGIKQYWFKENTTRPVKIENKVKDDNNEKDNNNFAYLSKGASFAAKVRFKNLSEDELGLLLWCIRLKPVSQLNIGKAKPYGFGRIKINNMKLELLDLRKMYSLDSVDFKPYQFYNLDKIDEYIENYKKYINAAIEKDKDIEEMISLKEFFLMKDAGKIPALADTKYLDINDGARYTLKPLPTPEEVIGNLNKNDRKRMGELNQKQDRISKQDKLGSVNKSYKDNANNKLKNRNTTNGEEGRLSSKIDFSTIDKLNLPKG